MSNRFVSYANTEVGQQLTEVIEQPERQHDYNLMCRTGRPAVQAVADLTRPIIEILPPEEQNEANQFVGWKVGQEMRRMNAQIVRSRAPVANATYKTGAVWKLNGDDAEVVTSLPEGCSRRVEVSVDGNVNLADVTAVSLAPKGPAKIHIVIAKGVPSEDALTKAKRYAKAEGYGVIWVQDPGKLLAI